ncbi:MAG TPA: electron transfer flavoprotein subunit beta/FixA family protein [Gemmatimonadaceae bacterium]|nr:electron transfer flavoprotein subunit beta/FixA family protein [Gemmatimonadaceae bacterium]
MKIAVCIKRVPDQDVRFKVAAGGKAIDEAGLKYDLSDFDGYAAEVAIQITEKSGAGEVTVISVGPDAVQETLRKALSMGAHRAVQLKLDTPVSDGAAIAAALAAEIKDGGYDLVLTGRMAVDTQNRSVGAHLAARLGLPYIGAITQLDTTGGAVKARRELEGAYELVECPLPAVLSIDEGIARARYPSLKGIMAAKKKPMEVRPAQIGEVRYVLDSLELPPERSGGRIIGEGPDAVPELVRLLKEEAKVL